MVIKVRLDGTFVEPEPGLRLRRSRSSLTSHAGSVAEEKVVHGSPSQGQGLNNKYHNHMTSGGRLRRHRGVGNEVVCHAS